MKKIKYLIIICVFIIIILVSSIFIINGMHKNSIINNDQKDNENYTNTPPEFSHDVSYQELYTISNCVNRFIDSINKNNYNYYDGKSEGIYNKDLFEERIESLLSENFKGKIKTTEEKNIFTAVNIVKSFSNKNVDTYVVYGFISNNNMNYLDELYCIVNLDTKNYTYSVEPLYNKYNSIEEVEPEKLSIIKKNDYNLFTYESLNDEKKCKFYFNYIKSLMLVKPEMVYTYLDDTYKQIRFKNIENFLKYTENNRNRIQELVVRNYKINDAGTEIYILDQNSNIMKFNIEGIMKFKVTLDDYIVMLDEEIVKYNDLSIQQKMVNCINRWIKMINSKDYEFAFRYLDETFRNNNFGSAEKFEKYIKQNWPEFINIKCSNYKEVNDVGTMDVKITERGVSEEELNKVIEKTFIVKLLDDNDFVMSFNVE